MKLLSTLLLLSFFIKSATAQTNPIDIQCDGRDKHSLYLVDLANGYVRVDSVDTHPTDPILLTTNTIQGIGLSINKNLDNNSGDISMYTCGQQGEYFYHVDTGWVDTHHTSGFAAAVNPGGTDQYIFNWDGSNGTVYRYDGTGNGTQLVTGLTRDNSIYDVATDKKGNFYIFLSTDFKILVYNSNGIPIDSFTTVGNPTGVEPGFAILDSFMYMVDRNPSVELFKGAVTGHTVNFSLIKTFPAGYSFSDMAACPDAGNELAVFKVPTAPHFFIYPNPATNKAIIKLDNTATIDITDCMGRKILSAPVRGLTQYELSLSGYTAGVYFVTATSPNGLVEHHSLVVQ